MNFGYGPGPEVPAAPPPAHASLAWHETGLVDELGERRLVFESGPTPSLELLRFRDALTAMPGFEVALRRRVQQLSAFRHPSFATIRAVQYLAGGQGLVLVSTYTPGRRLSELLRHGRDPSAAIALIRELTPALAALHAQAGGIAHGALAASRIVVSPEGRLIIREHVLGSALGRLELPADRLSAALGLALPPTERIGGPIPDSQTDLFQLGLIALSLLLGRQLSAEAGRTNAAKLLDDVLPPSDESASPWHGLRAWLRRALQLDGQFFRSSDEAVAALRELPTDGLEQTARQWQELVACSESQPVADPRAASPATRASTARESERDTKEAISSSSRGSNAPSSDVRREVDGKRNARLRTLAAAVAVCAIAEGLVIAFLLQTRSTAPSAAAPFADVQIETPDPGAYVLVDGRSAGLTPLKLKIGAQTQSISVIRSPRGTALPVGSTGEQTPAAEPEPEPPARVDGGTVDPPPAAAPAPQRTGGVRLVTPIEVDVFDGDRRLGSSATGIVSVAAGRHELDLVNSVLGFRVRELVDVKGGQVVSVTVTPPNGVVNINALPWADVWIDGKPVGQTPIGNLAVPIGEHEVLFRHPQLGEQRQTAVVRVAGVTRVSANLQRQPPPH